MRKKFLLAAPLLFAVLTVHPALAQNAPVVAVRAGAHDNFDRVVFDWPRNVKYELHRDGAKATITFDAAGEVKFSRDVQVYLSRARGFSAHEEGGHVTVSFTVSPNATLKTFTSSSSVVVDITGKAVAEAAVPAAAEPAAPATEAVAQPVLDNNATGKPEPLLPAAKNAPAKPAAAAVGKAAPPPSGPPRSTVAATVDAAAPAPSAAATATAQIKKPADSSDAVLSDTPMMVAMLDPHIATRAAIYQRADVGYIIFDRKLTLTPAALENGVPAQIDLRALDLPKNSGYRFAVPPNSDLQATLDGTVWKIFLSRKKAEPPVTTSLVAQPDFALGARFLLPLPDAPDAIHFTDPVVGDDLILIPLAQSEAFSAERNMLDFIVLPAAQGLVIKPKTDKIIVRTVSDGVEITAEGGLQLSRATDTGASQQSATKARASAAGKSVFDFATWGGKPGETFTRTRQRLQQTIVDVPEAERNRARLELARFYFANGNGEEALGLLNYLVKQVPDLRAHADFMALLGASEILAYRSDEGLRDLAGPGLADQPEIELWQAVGLAQQRNWQQAEEKFAIRESLLAGYPEPFFSRFFVLAIESALAAGKEHEASDWLDFVSNAPTHSTEIDPALSYLRGAIQAQAGRAGAAEDAWKETVASRDRLYKVRAELALIDLGISTASITPAQAVDRLEALRFGWRGDDLEVDILHRLGQFYIQAKNVKAGLNTMAQAISLYPSSPLAPRIRKEMEDSFREVFLGDLGKKLSPLDSLTIYQQYRDLMPTGKDGDAVMRNLSERLVAVDLLDQAASLLQDLAKRLTGEDKDHVALRLAGIRLLDHKPDEALKALDLIGGDSLTPAMQNEALLLRARTLSELHRDADAAALLKDNPSIGAKMLRADIAMHGQEWGDAAKALMELVGPPPASGHPLTAEQSGWLVNAAIAYALNNDQTGLDRLAIDYSAAMAGTPQNDTFRLLTEPEKTGQLRDLAAAQAQISQVDMFQGFLNNYRSSPEPDAAATKKP